VKERERRKEEKKKPSRHTATPTPTRATLYSSPHLDNSKKTMEQTIC